MFNNNMLFDLVIIGEVRQCYVLWSQYFSQAQEKGADQNINIMINMGAQAEAEMSYSIFPFLIPSTKKLI